ncbi:SEC-C metal-binding domain-containing protein [Nonomuraea rubra]|uniref:SEC-C metal-binding domain-containing protein n=1 Tax=Nonomuraea rubra TaxID=46180 RepID=UPI003CC51005
MEKLGGNDPCPCGSGRRFPPLLPPHRPVRRHARPLLRPRPAVSPRPRLAVIPRPGPAVSLRSRPAVSRFCRWGLARWPSSARVPSRGGARAGGPRAGRGRRDLLATGDP